MLKVGNLYILERDEVLGIYDSLASDFSESDDPITPYGIRSDALLDSALSRQVPLFSGIQKYSDPYSNAATLCFGICQNHPFYNGNKRTALVSMLAHLHSNGFVFTERINQKSLYQLMRDLAGHQLGVKRGEDEINHVSSFLRKNTRKMGKSEFLVTYRELRSLLQQHGYEVGPVKSGAKAEIFRIEERKKLFKGIVRERKKIGSIPFYGDKFVAGKSVLKMVRDLCGLTYEQGVDSEIFYGRSPRADPFLERYSYVLKRLART